MNETFNLNGLTFRAELQDDNDHGAPWVEECGHGDVRKVRANYTGYMEKKPGERLLTSEFNRSGLAYDYAGAMEIAARDGWGISDEERAKFQAQHRRAPTPREVTAMAVESDFQRMRGWATGEWGWVGVVVTLLDVEGDATDTRQSSWGIESDSDEYHDVVARELAEQIAADLGRRKFITQGASKTRVRV